MRKVFDFYGFFGKLVPKPLKPLYAKIGKEKVLYLFFGALTTAVSLVSFYIANKISTGLFSKPELIAEPVSFILAVCFAFFVNKKYVFESTSTGKAALKEALTFLTMRLSSFGLEYSVIAIFVTWLGFNAMIVKFLCQIMVLVLNFIFSKLIIFRKKKTS